MNERRGRLRILLRLLFPATVVALFAIVIVNEQLLERLLMALFPNAVQHLYDRYSLGNLLLQHLLLVSISTSAAVLVGILLGIFVTRASGRDFLPLVRNICSLAQTFPPAAVLALIAPGLGFGFKPTVVALFIFSILPIINNTIAGIEAIPRELLEASRGIGMSRMQVLLLSELPLAARVIAAGVRTSVIINIGTATVGALIGAGGLGVLIIAGLVRNNPAFLMSGALITAFFALLTDWGMGRLQGIFFSFRPRG